MIPLDYFVGFSALLFSIGLYGVLTKRHVLKVFISIEAMMVSANILLLSFSAYSNPFNPSGSAMVLFSWAVSAADIAIALALFLYMYKKFGSVDVTALNQLKW